MERPPDSVPPRSGARDAHPLDTAPLVAPITPAEVRAYRAGLGLHPDPWTVRGALPLGILAAIVWLLTQLPLMIAVASGRSAPSYLLIPLAGLAVIALLLTWAASASNASWRRRARIARFAAANGMHFRYDDGLGATGAWPGAIFQTGSDRTLVEHLVGDDPRPFDYGVYTYVTGSGKNRTTHDWGYLALTLDRRLPHLVLDSRANNGLFGGTNLPETFSRDQVLHLEGDFDRYFTLYCPSDYGRDALYVFTPDLMALLIDESAPYDVEIVDDRIYVYSSQRFDLTDPAVHLRLRRIVDTVGAKTLRQTARYEDDHPDAVPRSGEVAPAGRRLRRGVPVTAIVIVALIGAFWIWELARGMGH